MFWWLYYLALSKYLLTYLITFRSLYPSEYDKRQLKKFEEYSSRNCVSIAIKVSVTVSKAYSIIKQILDSEIKIK